MQLLEYSDSLKIKQEADKKYVFCRIRRKWLVLQPEEVVRQLFIHHLIDTLDYSHQKIAVERGLQINGVTRRFDILVYDEFVQPFILVECKSMFVDINQSTMQQVGQYNLPLKARFLVLTNGHKTVYCELNKEGSAYDLINQLPKMLK